MAGSIKRERQLARERYERQQARRAAAAAKRRRVQQITAVVVSVLLVVGGVAFLATLLGGNDSTTTAGQPSEPPSASASPSATTTPSPSAAAGACTYAAGTEKATKDVGKPTFDAKTAAVPFTATLKTDQGDIVIAMNTAKAPCTTNSFRYLATKKFYDASPCHRLTTTGIFVLQCGDPTGKGSGGPGYGFGVENVPAQGIFPPGSVAMARTQDPNSNGSQFFIVYKQTQLPTDPAGYSLFGTVTKGLDVVSKIAKAGVTGGGGDGPPKQKVTITSVQIGKG